jgi:predicted chitinase
MPVKMITKEELRRWSPKARPEYVDALLAGEALLREYGVLDSKLTLTHFMAQVGGETNGLTILREDMNYKSVSRVRAVWPARTRRLSDTWIAQNLINNPPRIASWAYGGRMGNEPWPSQDGYDYRGGGWIQTTGRYAVEKYCRKLGIKPHPGILDDFEVTLRFACFEWKEAGCIPYACANDILSISKIINTGSAKSGVKPNGMPERRLWFRKAWAIWGDDRRTIPDATGVTAADLKKAGSETVKMADGLKIASALGAAASGVTGFAKNAPQEVLPVVSPLASPIDPTLLEGMKVATETSDLAVGLVTSLKGAFAVLTGNLWIFGILCGVAGFFFAKNIIERRVADARLGLNTARVTEDSDGVPA